MFQNIAALLGDPRNPAQDLKLWYFVMPAGRNSNSRHLDCLLLGGPAVHRGLPPGPRTSDIGSVTLIAVDSFELALASSHEHEHENSLHRDDFTESLLYRQ